MKWFGGGFAQKTGCKRREIRRGRICAEARGCLKNATCNEAVLPPSECWLIKSIRCCWGKIVNWEPLVDRELLVPPSFLLLLSSPSELGYKNRVVFILRNGDPFLLRNYYGEITEYYGFVITEYQGKLQTGVTFRLAKAGLECSLPRVQLPFHGLLADIDCIISRAFQAVVPLKQRPVIN